MRFTVPLESLENPDFREAMRKQREYETSREIWRLEHPEITKEEIARGEKESASRLETS